VCKNVGQKSGCALLCEFWKITAGFQTRNSRRNAFSWSLFDHTHRGESFDTLWAQRGYLGIHAEVPTAQCLRSAIVVNGAPQIKSEAA
jgi:hypothetical protein